MKTRILAAVMATAALSGLLVASPAQARDGVSSARVDPFESAAGRDYGGGSVRATVDSVSRTKVVFRNFTVRDICPGDNLPIKGRVWWEHTDGTHGYGAWRSDTNGCGDDGTNFGNITRTGTKSISSVYVQVCSTYCDHSAARYNQYVRPGR
ncbi:hypothetical protein [Nonomuraea basaltis]|uniref:hypothetical protein n=1 Tax=Nonomuraea basaltis TaxID=2495887 RepID=UPI00110C5BD6|nr:hypothetical protein [Nonomuraea basaltis]TMR87906.1 hypothetical protein EJK15_69215 [Nonomuraea basaltis]